MKILHWIIISAVIHLLVLFVLRDFHEKALYAVDSGHNSIEVNLVAAPQETVEPKVPQPPAPPIEPQPEIPPIVQTPSPTPPPVQEIPKPPVEVVQKEHSDNSSPKPGKDATTLHSDSGAMQPATANYLHNPSPIYPEEARRLRQEGIVMLSVVVNTEGRATSIEVSRTSGFPLLDQAAIKAVKKWVFRPASLAGIQLESTVLIPVHFRLES